MRGMSFLWCACPLFGAIQIHHHSLSVLLYFKRLTANAAVLRPQGARRYIVPCSRRQPREICIPTYAFSAYKVSLIRRLVCILRLLRLLRPLQVDKAKKLLKQI